MSVFVSLTSTSFRLEVLRYTLLSLKEQSLKPDQINLCISKHQYLSDEGITDLPDWLHTLETNNEVTINWVNNTGPYRKLLPTLESAEVGDLIVTCDDDVIYGREWLKCLVNDAIANPEAIICGRARTIKSNMFGGVQSYLRWPIVPGGSRGSQLMPIGISGVVYRKELLLENMVSTEDYKLHAQKQDDIWFYFSRANKDVETYVSRNAENHVHPIEAPGALALSNAFKNANHGRLVRLYAFFINKVKGYLGYSICANDIAYKKSKHYRANILKS